ncbi:DgyrCDS10605 [Dimorphilus gyrociliatus]|uniref:Ragulator complex protein LAMTOR1 n=1 Tax=Dimorphilus gyrociliatus TaxID=2664684 RepID=A0A7I8W2P9_9ANNE|nr:DgyrCDS10605 [Dimorphilus gyrociliatus]
MEYQESESEESRRLLSEGSSENGGFDTTYHTMQIDSSSGDEQSALLKIVQRTADRVIDVSAINSTNMEYQDLADRENQYRQKLNLTLSSSLQKKKILTVGIRDPQAVLSSPLIDSKFITLVQQAALAANNAVSEIKIQHKENLVVPFTVP